MARDQFSALRPGQRLQDRGGRVWTVHAEAYEQDRELRIVIRSGDLVRHALERHADDYMLMTE